MATKLQCSKKDHFICTADSALSRCFELRSVFAEDRENLTSLRFGSRLPFIARAMIFFAITSRDQFRLAAIVKAADGLLIGGHEGRCRLSIKRGIGSDKSQDIGHDRASFNKI